VQREHRRVGVDVMGEIAFERVGDRRVKLATELERERVIGNFAQRGSLEPQVAVRVDCEHA
jgi:hypothetical protein